MSATKLVNGLADTARAAARTLSAATAVERAGALNAIADAILARSAEIIAANEEDMVRARAAKINDSLLDRLL
ncbi:MAG: gamma-glutamyl-phosphate reductase, partial [Actinobacteria bacterium]|nr:gamma-glutamyl-phosphate reductase [Actinomycetota bacterium]